MNSVSIPNCTGNVDLELQVNLGEQRLILIHLMLWIERLFEATNLQKRFAPQKEIRRRRLAKGSEIAHQQQFGGTIKSLARGEDIDEVFARVRGFTGPVVPVLTSPVNERGGRVSFHVHHLFCQLMRQPNVV